MEQLATRQQAAASLSLDEKERERERERERSSLWSVCLFQHAQQLHTVSPLSKCRCPPMRLSKEQREGKLHGQKRPIGELKARTSRGEPPPRASCSSAEFLFLPRSLLLAKWRPVTLRGSRIFNRPGLWSGAWWQRAALKIKLKQRNETETETENESSTPKATHSNSPEPKEKSTIACKCSPTASHWLHTGLAGRHTSPEGVFASATISHPFGR